MVLQAMTSCIGHANSTSNFTFQMSFLLSNLKCSSIGAESRIHPRLVEICAYLGCQIFEIQPGRGLAPGLLCLLEAMIL